MRHPRDDLCDGLASGEALVEGDGAVALGQAPAPCAEDQRDVQIRGAIQPEGVREEDLGGGGVE